MSDPKWPERWPAEQLDKAREQVTNVEYSAALLPMPTQCDRCSAEPVAVIACAEKNCQRKYARCAKHGGAAGCDRSYRSHRGLYHPKELRK